MEGIDLHRIYHTQAPYFKHCVKVLLIIRIKEL